MQGIVTPKTKKHKRKKENKSILIDITMCQGPFQNSLFQGALHVPA